MKIAYGIVDRVIDVPSRQVTRIIVEIPIEAHAPATLAFYQKRVIVSAAPDVIEGPYGLRDLDTGQSVDDAARPTRPEVGPLCKLAVQWCKDPKFHDWLVTNYPSEWARNEAAPSDERAKGVICRACGVVSRKELDESDEARTLFERWIRKPYLAWLADVKAGLASLPA